MHIVILCGTNRDGSLSRMLSKQAAGIYTDLGHSVDLLDMNEITPEFLAPTAYKEQGDNITGLVSRFMKADGVVCVIPEYNGSFPGILKLFIDMLPFPEGLDQRACAFIGLAAGQFQGLRAVEHFQQVVGYRNALQFPRRLFIGDSYKQFDFATGLLADQELTDRLQQQSEQFCDYVAKNKGL